MGNISFGSTTALACMPPFDNGKGKKNIGQPHNRAQELIAHKDVIQIASSQMVEAIANHDYEQANQWSQVIDSAQDKIFRIVDQEDKHSSQKVSNRKSDVETIVDVAKTACDITKQILPTQKLDLII